MKHATPQMIRQFLLRAQGMAEPDLPFHEWAIPFGVHLLHQCPECLQAVHEAFAQWRGWPVDDPRVADLAFEYLYRRGVPAEDLTRQARRDADEEVRFRAPALVDELLRRCQALPAVDPKGALELAELAVEIAWRTDPEVVGNLAFHARARALAHQANALRLNNQRATAEEAFRQAHQLYGQATLADTELEAEILDLEASLATDQRRFATAAKNLARARELYSRSSTQKP